MQSSRIRCLLSRSGLVAEYTLLEREACSGVMRQTAYVVPATAASPKNIKAQLEKEFARSDLECSIVLINSLPFNAEGDPDVEILADLPVCDDALITELESVVQLYSGVEAATASEQDISVSTPSVSLNCQSAIDTALPHDDSKEPCVQTSSGGDARPSIMIGEVLDESRTPGNLAQCLRRAADSFPTHGVTYVRNDGGDFFETFPELMTRAEALSLYLSTCGVRPGHRVIFQLERSADFIGAFWACQIGGFVPVPIGVAPDYADFGAIVTKLRNAWELLGKPIVLTSCALADGIAALEKSFDMHGLTVAVIEDSMGFAPESVWHNPEKDDVALILLTSGSTGAPKAVMQSHRSLLNRTAATSQMNDFGSQDVILNWLPLDHVGGIVMSHLMSVFLCCQDIIAPGEKFLQEPLKWLDWIDKYRVTNTWAPSFAFGLVNSQEKLSEGTWDLSSLRYLFNGGEAVVSKVARRFLVLLQPFGLQDTVMHPVWGMSETSSGVIFSDKFTLGLTSDADTFVQVGSPIPDFSARIVNEMDRIVPMGESGRLQVTGPSVTSGYFGNEKRTRESFTKDGWFITGDLGVIRDGCLTITGRDEGSIIINGINFSSHEIESIVEDIPGVKVSFTAACPVRRTDGDTEDVAVFFCRKDDSKTHTADLVQQVRAAVRTGIGLNPTYVIPVESQQIPKTEIGKIQRSVLSRAFEQGEFNNAISKFQDPSGIVGSLPNWFYSQTWHVKQLPTNPTDPINGGSALIFLDGSGAGLKICSRLRDRGVTSIVVADGPRFEKIADDEYSIDPGNAEDYRRLFAELSASLPDLTAIIHCRALDLPAEKVSSDVSCVDAGIGDDVIGLLLLVQAFSDSAYSASRLTLQVIASHSIGVLKEDTIIPWRGAIQGLLKTIAQEYPGILVQYLDLCRDDQNDIADCATRELQFNVADDVVAYRNGKRLIPQFSRLSDDESTGVELPFKTNGLYVIAGGLGGIGTLVSRFLIEKYQARLVLLGRTLPAYAEKSDAFADLSRQEADVVYRQADVGDAIAMKGVIEDIETRFESPIDGIIHSAGAYVERPLAEETAETMIAAAGPLLRGLLNYCQIVDERPGSLLITFSSVNGFFGGVSAGAYAAANSAIDGFMRVRTRTNKTSHSLAWTMWDETGMSREFIFKDLSKSRGFHILQSRDAMQSLQWALRSSERQVWIGLNETNPVIGRHVHGVCRSLTSPAVFCTGAGAEGIKEIHARDRFGVECSAIVHSLSQDLRLPDGSIDLSRLAGANNGSTTVVTSKKPATDLESQIAKVWHTVLGVDDVGIDDNFFDCGGTSISIARVSAQLRNTTELDVNLTMLFRFPTIRALASALSKDDDQGSRQRSDRGGERREKMMRRRRGLTLPEHRQS